MFKPFPRADLATPALVLDLPAFERNLAKMAEWASRQGIALRPHAKTHKSGEIARRQIEAGAVGICCAKLGEAEALAAEGISDILVTSPIVSAQALERVSRLGQRVTRLTLVVDHPDNVDRLAALGEKIALLVDVDTGPHRTGVTSPAAAVSLAGRIAASPSLDYAGVQYYCGTLQHIVSLKDRRQALAERAAYLQEVIDALHQAELAPGIVSGGGTGSFEIDAEIGLLNELQPGSYLFMDRQYGGCEASGLRFEQALFIDSRVVSANTPGCATLDAGLKAMATEAGPPLVAAGAHPDSLYRFMGDEHGLLLTPEGQEDPALDRCIALVPPHCDPTVNLYDLYAICVSDQVVDMWPVSARGRSA